MFVWVNILLGKCIPKVTFIAGEQNPDKPCCNISRCIYMGVVDPGEAGGIRFGRGKLFCHLPSVRVVCTRSHSIILLIPTRCTIRIQRT